MKALSIRRDINWDSAFGNQEYRIIHPTADESTRATGNLRRRPRFSHNRNRLEFPCNSHIKLNIDYICAFSWTKSRPEQSRRAVCLRRRTEKTPLLPGELIGEADIWIRHHRWDNICHYNYGCDVSAGKWAPCLLISNPGQFPLAAEMMLFFLFRASFIERNFKNRGQLDPYFSQSHPSTPPRRHYLTEG